MGEAPTKSAIRPTAAQSTQQKAATPGPASAAKTQSLELKASLVSGQEECGWQGIVGSIMFLCYPHDIGSSLLELTLAQFPCSFLFRFSSY